MQPALSPVLDLSRETLEPGNVAHRAQLRLQPIAILRFGPAGRPVFHEAIDREVASGGVGGDDRCHATLIAGTA